MRRVWLALPVLLFSALLAAQVPPPKSPRPKPAAAAIPASPAELKFPPLRPIQIPKVETATLPNGMKIYLLEDHELPLVDGTALVRTGNLFDPPDKIGLATMTGMVLRTGGSKAKTGDEIDVQLENIAASVESSIRETNGVLSFSSLKRNADEVLGVFKELLTGPEFRQEKVDLAKTQLRSSISRRNDDAHGVAQREFAEIVYGKDTPYGWRMEYATIDNISRNDLAGFYQRYYFPANIMLAVRGDFSTAEMQAKLQKLFADWTVQQPPVPPFPKVREKPAPGVYVATKKDVTQTFFAAGHLGGELRDKDTPALDVMADILGGGFRSRLFQKVRTQMGWAYSISADWSANYGSPGLFEVAGSTKTMSTVDTIKAVQQEIERIRTAEVADEELKTAKDTSLNGFVFAFDTRSKTLGRLITYEYYNYPKDFIDQYQKALAAVTKADVLRASKEHIRPQDLTIVAVGNPQDFGSALATLGLPVTSIDLTIPEPKKTRAAVDPASLQQGKALLQRAQQAVGGAEKLAAVRDARQLADFQMSSGPGGMSAKQTVSWLAPSYMRQENQFAFGRLAAYTDGKSGWLSTPQGTGTLRGAQLKQMQGELFRFWFSLLLSDRDPNRTVNYAGDGALEISGKDGNAATLYIDEKTGVPQKVTYEAEQAGGPPVRVEDSYLELRDVDGLKVPAKISIVQGGRKSSDVVITETKLNSGLKKEDLEKQP